MKGIIILAALFMSIGVYAQETTPKFEKQGDQVKATYYHDNGTIAQAGFFKEGKLNGEWVMFDQGERIALGSYLNGKKVGKWTFWEANTIREVVYEDNQIASVMNKQKADPMVIK